MYVGFDPDNFDTKSDCFVWFLYDAKNISNNDIIHVPARHVEQSSINLHAFLYSTYL